MHNKYGPKGLTILAVNAWNEPKVDLARFATDNKLSHRILLEGKDVGREKYGIRGVPANFWINREGKIVRQLEGFEEGEVKKMEKWIEEIL